MVIFQASGLQSGSSTSHFAKPLGKGQLLGCHAACPWQPEKGLPTTVSSNVAGKSLNEMEVEFAGKIIYK